MIRIEYPLGMSPEYEAVKRRLDALRDQYSTQLLEYTVLTDTLRPNLEAEYMMAIGRKEYQLFSLQVEYQQYKREISLYQAALNHGVQMTAAAVADIIEQEFEEYQTQLGEQLNKVVKAEQQFAAEKLSVEESKAIRQLYRTLVRKLHPDLNPNLPPQAATFWNRVVVAYQASNGKQLMLLADMVNEFFAGKRDVPETPNSMDELRQQIQTLSDKIENLQKQMDEIQSNPPFTFRELLNNPVAVLQKRMELDQQIATYTEQLNTIRKIRDELRGNDGEENGFPKKDAG